MILAVAGCGGSSTRTVTAVAPVTTTTAVRTVRIHASPRPTGCTDYLYGHSALVTFSSQSADVSAVCRSWVTVNAREGEYWIEASADGKASSPAGVRRVCSLETRKGRLDADVNAQPGDIFGRAACAGLLSAGWTERPAR
jgi:hypothetical protein